MAWKKSLFVAASAKNMGKTSTCTGLVKGLRDILNKAAIKPNVGYMKPLGQKLIPVSVSPAGPATVSSKRLRDQGVCDMVDKDVPVFKQILGCEGELQEMSPVKIDKDYTKRFLDGGISPSEEFAKIQSGFDSLERYNEYVIVEGAGHTGVGSMLGLGNPRIAAKLDIPLILVLNGGIGSSIDDFLLSRAYCEASGVRIRGVILNKIKPSKMDQVIEYTGNYIQNVHNVPILGYVTDLSSISSYSHSSKLNCTEVDRVLETATHYQENIDFKALFDAVGWDYPDLEDHSKDSSLDQDEVNHVENNLYMLQAVG